MPGQGYPAIFTAGFSAGAGATAGSIGYGEEVAPTLKGTASGNCMPSILCFNNQGGERMDLTEDKTATLRAQMGGHQPVICLNDQGGSVMACSEDVAGTLRAQEHGHQPLVFDNHGQDTRFLGPVHASQTVSATFGMGGNNQPLVLATQQGGAEVGAGVCPTITAAAGMSGNNQPVLFENHGIDARYTGPHIVAPTMSARYGTGGNNVPIIAQESDSPRETAHAIFSRQRVDVFKDDEITCTQSARQHKDATDLVMDLEMSSVNSSSGDGVPVRLIRRLTPLECERLQGFPDHWTDLPGASDSARYKALGNSVAAPCVDFVLRGIAYFLRRKEESHP